MGSPIRPVEEGGILKLNKSQKEKIDSGEELDLNKTLAKSKATADASACKGSIELYAFLNENSINRIRDRITPSASNALTKAQRTR